MDAKVPRMTWMQLKEMANKGHEISNHSWSHKKMSRLPLARIKDEIEKMIVQFLLTLVLCLLPIVIHIIISQIRFLR